jgi:hypothetical protein
MIKYGFTGTRDGLNTKQKESIISLLQNDIKNNLNIEVYHGDCIGADYDFHNICRSISPNIKINIFPGFHSNKNEINNLRVYCQGDSIFEPKPYLERNKDIVNNCDVLIGCPKTKEEELRSGTWQTIRYARKINKLNIIFV